MLTEEQEEQSEKHLWDQFIKPVYYELPIFHPKKPSNPLAFSLEVVYFK